MAMASDARFEDGSEEPIALRAFDPEDLRVLSSLVQDAVFPITEMRFERRKRRFAILLNRFRWEDRSPSHAPERVQSILAVEDVLSVKSQGIDRGEDETILSLLSLDWVPGEDGGGRLTLTLAGDGAVALSVEALEATLRDVTRPYLAPSGRRPDHPL